MPPKNLLQHTLRPSTSVLVLVSRVGSSTSTLVEGSKLMLHVPVETSVKRSSPAQTYRMKLAVESCTPPSTRPAPRKLVPRNSSFSVPIVSHALARRGKCASHPSFRAVLEGP